MRDVIAAFREAHGVLGGYLNRAQKVPLPPMKNFQAGTPLGNFLLEEEFMYGLDPRSTSLSGEWINGFLRQYGEVLDKVRRIHFKSLSGVLALQDEIVRRWHAQQAAPAEGQVATGSGMAPSL